MTNIVPGNNSSTPDWKVKAYLVGVIAGAVFGFVTSYLYARAAQEDAAQDQGKPRSPSTGELVTLALAGLGLVRQISELGKPPKKR